MQHASAPSHSDTSFAELVTALRDASQSITDQAAKASVDARIVRGGAYATLREQGVRRSHIRRLMRWSRRELRQAARAPAWSGSSAVSEVWGAVNLSLPWYRSAHLLSSQVMRANNITPSHFATVDRCDNPGAEYVNAATGEKWLILTQQRWDGIPDPADRGRMSHDGGHYEVWHVAAAGTLTPFGALDVGAAANYTSSMGSASAAFETVHSALLIRLRTVRDVPLTQQSPRRRMPKWGNR